MIYPKQTYKQKQKATEFTKMDERPCKSLIQWNDFFFFLALPAFHVFPEHGQLEGVYKIFLDTKVKFLHSCHNNSSLNKLYLKKNLLEHFTSINESEQVLERYCKLIKWPQGQDENLKFEIQKHSSSESLVKVAIWFDAPWEVYCLSPIAWVIDLSYAWDYESSARIYRYCVWRGEGAPCSTQHSTWLMEYSINIFLKHV